MARKLAAILILILLLAAAAYFWYLRQQHYAELAAHWLARDCTVTDQAALETEIRDAGEALEPLFLQAFANGPPQREMDALLASIDRIYSRRQQRVRAGKAYQEPGMANSLSLPDERQQAKNNFDHGYRAAALNALRIIGRSKGVELLRRLAAQDSASPFQYLARLALQRQRVKR